MIPTLSQVDISGWAAHYVLVFMRVMGVMMFVPILGADMLPIRFRLTFGAVLAFTFLPLAPVLGSEGIGPIEWCLAGGRELLVGLVMGLGARMIFVGVEMAAGLTAGQSGFALAAMVDPSSGEQSLAPGLFQSLLATSLFLAADLHHVFVRGIVGSYELLAPGVTLPALGSAGASAGLMGMRMLDVAINLTGPALIVTIAMDLVMVLVGKAMPQVPILMVAYPLKMIVGLVAMWVLAISTGAAIGWLSRLIANDSAALVRALAGNG